MTYRERRLAKAERLREWADKREVNAAAVFAEGERYRGDIAFNTQPGHIPERAKLIAREDRALESLDKARAMERRASSIETQLDSSIYSDDVNAIEAIEARIASREAEADRYKRVNAAFKKAEGADRTAKLIYLVKAGVLTEKEGLDIATFFARCHWEDRPFPSYALTNLRANIRRDRERIEEIRRRQARASEAEAAGGVSIKECGTNSYDGEVYVRVTFAEKPERSVLDALKAAGFSWGGGSWTGTKAKLPPEVAALATV